MWAQKLRDGAETEIRDGSGEGEQGKRDASDAAMTSLASEKA
jgi:hypothetical protein